MKTSKKHKLSKKDLSVVFVHPRALVESTMIGKSTRVWAFAHVMQDAEIGTNCNICDHVFIESSARIGNNVTIKNGVAVWDGVKIEDDVFIGPNVVFTNDLNPRAEVKKPREQWLSTLVQKGATIGANATVLCGISVGAYGFVAAGTVVTSSVPNYALVVGVPGRLRGWMCKCGTKLQVVRSRATCSVCGLRFVKATEGLRNISA